MAIYLHHDDKINKNYWTGVLTFELRLMSYKPGPDCDVVKHGKDIDLCESWREQRLGLSKVYHSRQTANWFVYSGRHNQDPSLLVGQ